MPHEDPLESLSHCLPGPCVCPLWQGPIWKKISWSVNPERTFYKVHQNNCNLNIDKTRGGVSTAFGTMLKLQQNWSGMASLITEVKALFFCNKQSIVQDSKWIYCTALLFTCYQEYPSVINLSICTVYKFLAKDI